MNEIGFPLTRSELLSRGYLVNVWPMAELVGITIAMDVSFTLFHDNPDGDLHFTMNYPIGGRVRCGSRRTEG